MTITNSNKIFKFFIIYLPIILLFTSVLNEFDFNHLGTKYFSFNFSYILIFYYSLKRNKSLGYGLIFIAGLFNDVVAGSLIGISSFNFLLICGFAAYLRNITLRPSLIKDWIFFLITISVINSLSYMLMTFIFGSQMNYFDILVNTLFTFLLYFIFSFLFNIFEEKFIGRQA
jgi:rod shape-determining protein MreD